MMHTRRIARFRPRRSLEQGPSLWRRILTHSGAVLVTLAGLALAYGLWWAPEQLMGNFILQLSESYNSRHFADLQKVERHWMALPFLPPFRRGDEEPVKRFLEQQPLVEAMLDRTETRILWVREGDRLVRAADSPRVQLYRAWITQAEVGQRFQWTPTTDHDPEHTRVASTVLLGDQWIVIKRWEPGSRRVEEALHRIFGTHAPMRIGMIHQADMEAAPQRPREAWGAEPHWQVDPTRLASIAPTAGGQSDTFGEGWSLVGIPWSPERKLIRAQLVRQEWIGRLVALAVAAAMGGGLWLRRRARQRALLDADRMASLTHSLKTPLAVLKFRCDSIRLGRLTGEQADAELLRIGEEVDNLTQMIEHGLASIQGDPAQGPQREVSPVWLMAVAEDLRPAYEADNRPLELTLCPDSGRAALPSLRPALLTLLENALFHGSGKVLLETWRKGRRFSIRVSDEGAGVDAVQLASLGRPFMRIRREGKEGFTREGQGLGLSLLCQVAQQEGWGLSFASAPGKGFQVTLTLAAM